MEPPPTGLPPAIVAAPMGSPASSLGKIMERLACKAVRGDGNPCRSPASHGTGLCRHHGGRAAITPSKAKDRRAKSLVEAMLGRALEGRAGAPFTHARAHAEAGSEAEPETRGSAQERLLTPTVSVDPSDTIVTSPPISDTIVTSYLTSSDTTVTLPPLKEDVCPSSVDAPTAGESSLESVGVGLEERLGVGSQKGQPSEILNQSLVTLPSQPNHLVTPLSPTPSSAPVGVTESYQSVRVTKVTPVEPGHTVPAYSHQLEGLRSEGPRYELRDKRFKKAVEAKRGRLDLMDLREELAVMEALAEACMNGLNPWHMREILKTIANAKGVEKAGLQKIAGDCLERLGEGASPGVVLELVKEIRTLSKTLVDIEISMKKAVTQERMNRIIVELVQIVRKHVSTEQMSLISNDFVASKDMMV